MKLSVILSTLVVAGLVSAAPIAEPVSSEVDQPGPHGPPGPHHPNGNHHDGHPKRQTPGSPPHDDGHDHRHDDGHDYGHRPGHKNPFKREIASTEDTEHQKPPPPHKGGHPKREAQDQISHPPPHFGQGNHPKRNLAEEDREKHRKNKPGHKGKHPRDATETEDPHPHKEQPHPQLKSHGHKRESTTASSSDESERGPQYPDHGNPHGGPGPAGPDRGPGSSHENHDGHPHRRSEQDVDGPPAKHGDDGHFADHPPLGHPKREETAQVDGTRQPPHGDKPHKGPGGPPKV